MDQELVALGGVGIFATILPGHFLVGFIADGNIVQIKLLNGQVDIVSVDFIEVMCATAIHTNPVNRPAKHIINQHSGNGALPVRGIGRNPLCLTGWIGRFFTPYDL